MRVSVEEIAAAFSDLISGARPREAIASWATAICTADDRGTLKYSPPHAEAAIWDALTYLMGVDLRSGPDTYLHSRADFEEYWAINRSALLR